MPWNAVDISDRHPALGPFYDIREMVLAAMLSALAGSTGAAAWLYTSGWFVTFMTGNSERLVLEHLRGRHVFAVSAAATVGCFILGGVSAALARLFVWRRARHGATLMSTVAIVAAWGCDVVFVDDPRTIGIVPVLCLAFGLGALNTSISRRGEVVMPLSYMTGTLVKIGQGAALHLSGVRSWAWVPHLTTYAGFLFGAGVGGLIFTTIGTHNSLLALAVLATLIAAVTWRLDHPGFLTQDAR